MKDHKKPKGSQRADDPPAGAGAAVELPIDGILDLHAFAPEDVKSLVPGYIEECLRRGILDLRIIHGKGTGTMKGIVHRLLEKNPHVAGFKDAGLGGGGWGATTVRLKR